MEQPIYLLLENGEWFEGKSFGAQSANSGISGEVVFHHRHDGVSGDSHRSQLLRTDRGADLSAHRKLRNHPRGF